MILGGYGLWQVHSRKGWPATYCEVTGLRSHRGGSARLFQRVWVWKYVYIVSGVEYSGQWRGTDRPRDPVVIYYNPEHPERSVGDRKAGETLAAILLIAAPALILAGLSIWLG